MCPLPRTAEKKTVDHVFPRSWYPETTPGSVQRWTVPACEVCNHRLSFVEQDLLIRLGLCLDSTAAAASGIAFKALRSLGVGADGLSDKERSHRDNLRNKIEKEMLSWDQVKGRPGMLPGFGPHKGFPAENQLAIRVPHDGLVALAKKIVRGLEFQLMGRYVEAPYEIRVFFIEPEAAETITRSVFANLREEHVGPGLRVIRNAAIDDRQVVLYEMLIWGTLTIHAVVDLASAFRSE